VPGAGVYPGSFNPLTRAHLAIAEAAVAAHELDRLDFVISRVALGKEHLAAPGEDERLAVLDRAAATRPWMAFHVTDVQLVSTIAHGYDVVVMGADKWVQLHDLTYYGGSVDDRDAALARLPRPAIVDRPPLVAPPEHRLVVPEEFTHMSSSGVRDHGRTDWLAPEARRRK
jgi:hypothetical protein